MATSSGSCIEGEEIEWLGASGDVAACIAAASDTKGKTLLTRPLDASLRWAQRFHTIAEVRLPSCCTCGWCLRCCTLWPGRLEPASKRSLGKCMQVASCLASKKTADADITRREADRFSWGS